MTLRAPANMIGAALFSRVLVGVDGTDAGLQAALQAGRLVAPDGELELASAIYLIDANLQHWPQERVEATLELERTPALQAAATRIGRRATRRLLNGPAKQTLLEEAERFRATLIAVGSHEHSRVSEILIGGVTGPLLHDATCSVLLARDPVADALFPRRIAVGVDGSPGSLGALSVGEYLSVRFGASLRAVLACQGDVDLSQAERWAPQLEIVDSGAVDALVDVSSSADLVIVGSRGLRGLRALGSVSERLAHRARSSVLVVRPGLHGDPAGTLGRSAGGLRALNTHSADSH
jgi:nucleotide-binding universal stress UspA family protein